MTTELWLPQPIGVPTPAELATYLLASGWTFEAQDEHWAQYGREMNGARIVIELPLHSDARDYARAVAVLLADLARLEGVAQTMLLSTIKAATTDLVRLALEGPSTRDGRIPVDAGSRVFASARELLLAAASAVIKPRSVLPKRKPDAAMRLLERACFGPTECGSFVLTLELAVPPLLQLALLPEAPDPDAPLERRTSTLLATALQAAQTASRQSSASGQLEPFTARAADGVSSQLCAAVADLLEASKAERLAAAFSFASVRPVANSVPRQVTFASDTAPVLREAARRLRELAPEPDAELLGPVIKLNSANPAEGGVAVLRADVNGRLQSVSVAMNATAYAQAIVAHRDRLMLRCVGELEREGRALVLRGAREVEAVPESDESCAAQSHPTRVAAPRKRSRCVESNRARRRPLTSARDKALDAARHAARHFLRVELRREVDRVPRRGGTRQVTASVEEFTCFALS